MEYVRHKYSKRVYQVMTDHGPDHPYLSCFPYIRYCGVSHMEGFFISCQGPSQDSDIKVNQEIEWEKRQLRSQEPIIVQAPSMERSYRNERFVKSKTRKSKGEYTLSELCEELGMSTAKARKILRSSGKKSPEGGWKWPNKGAAGDIKEILKKS